MSKKSKKHAAKPFRAWLSIGGEPLPPVKKDSTAMANDSRLEDALSEQFDDDAEELPKAPPTSRSDASTAVLGAAFDAATTQAVRRRLAHGQSLAVILHVPNPSWVKPATEYFARVFGDRWAKIARDGTQRGIHKAEWGSDEIAAYLVKGRCVVGIAADVSILPHALVIHGDITVRLSSPDGAVLRAAISRFTGRNPGRLADGHAPGLDLPAILAAFRPGSGGKRIADRLAAAAAAARGDSVEGDRPRLADAVEYGSAREWGLGLARDIVDYRAGRIGWSDLPRGLVLAGEPGTGKSLFSGMLAEACGLPLVRTSVSDWFSRDSYLHNTIQAVQAVFDRAASMAPAIIFLDECDALPNRATLGERNKDYWKPLINFVLLKLDNAITSTREGVIVIAATNDSSDLDPALVRPGRLEKILRIERPDLAGTLHILQHHVRGDCRTAISRSWRSWRKGPPAPNSCSW
jgi:cell division protease FtsH